MCPVGEAIEHDHEEEHDQEAAGFFLIVLVVVLVLDLPGGESNRARRRGGVRPRQQDATRIRSRPTATLIPSVV